MKRFTPSLLMVLIFLFPSMIAVSQNCEGFDNLTSGNFVAEQLGENWSTWNNAPGTAEDAMISEMMLNSKGNSLLINSETIDLVYKLSDQPIAEGRWTYSHNIYIPSGMSGTFNIQSETSAGGDVVVELLFNDDASATIIENNTEHSFTYTPDEWIFLEMNFDFTSGTAQVLMNSELVVEYTNRFAIGCVDFFGWNGAGTPGAYYDDVCFGMEQLTAMGIDDVIFFSIQVYPNPATTMVNVESDYFITHITVVNSNGVIISEISSNDHLCQINTEDYNPGSYTLWIQTNLGPTTKQVMCIE